MASSGDLRRLTEEAERLGARAKIIRAKDIVIDDRVRLKCLVPLCSSYGKNLMCPPNLISVNEFRRIISRYENGVLIQVDSQVGRKTANRRNKASGAEVTLRESKLAQLKLHEIVNKIEALAFGQGHYLSAGLIGGDCALCRNCVATEGSQPCRHPFRARPSMEGMGIDVIETTRRLGVPVRFLSKEKVTWTGLILVD